MIRRITWWIFGFLCVMIGLYPATYFLIDREFGLLSTKDQELLSNVIWNIGFYGHIVLGAVALTIGWLQFSKKIRTRNLALHRRIGIVYVAAVTVSGLCALYIGLFATGGLVSSFGFIGLGITWLITTWLSYRAILSRKVDLHENLMIFSYAACFAAVTLRIWLPILTTVTGDFILAYQMVAWLCWVPNMLVAYLIVYLKRQLSVVKVKG